MPHPEPRPYRFRYTRLRLCRGHLTTMNRSTIDSIRHPRVIALMLLCSNQTLGAQDAFSTSLPDSAGARVSSTPRSGWTGFYIGAHTGVSGGGSDWSATQPGVPNLSGSVNIFHSYSLRDESGSHFGGVAAGYNYALPSRLVIGVEGDVSFGAEPVISAAPFDGTPQVYCTARGRVGYNANRWLYYGTG